MEVRITLEGVSPLLMHNIRLNDRDDEFTRQIAAIAAKRKKTDEDYKDLARLEWFGGLYVEDGVPVVPTRNVRRCLIEAGKITRQGTQVQRGVIPLALNVQLDYDGPNDLEK